MKHSRSLFVPIAFAFLAAYAGAQQAVSVTELQGAWKLKSLSFDGADQAASGYLVFNGHHYSFITTRARRKFTSGMGIKPFGQLTEDEKALYVEAFRNMTCAAGTFSVEGDEVVLTMEVVRTPSLEGGNERRKSRFEGPLLVQDFMGGGRRQIYVWEKVGARP
jgi:hypothetical protein